MATQTSATLSTHEDGALRAKKVGRSVVAVLAAALAAATLAFFAAEARAGSFDSEPPEAVLMKYKTVLQVRSNDGGTWYYYEGSGWSFIIYDNFGMYAFPEPDTVGAGRRLHVRFEKPESPSTVEINAYPRVGENGYRPSGQRRQLERTLRPVKQNGETVGWDVFFRVNRSRGTTTW